MRVIKQLGYSLGIVMLGVGIFLVSSAKAADNGTGSDGFALEVSPSPLVETVKPGESKTVELRIHNNNTKAEQLKLELQSFTVDNSNGQVTLNNTPPDGIRDWVKFEKPRFNVNPGEWATQKVTIQLPESAGFTYSFAIVVSRQSAQRSSDEKANIEGSVAIFSLISVDKPGATSKLDVAEVTSSKRVYEYLPATFNLKLKNSGNTLLRPAGNVYIQRSAKSTDPIAVLNLNPAGSYLLPGVTREFTVAWDDGFPHYTKTQEAVNVEPKRHLEWNWGKSTVRIGKYVAHVVAVYNDGQRDVPVRAEVTFWVIPWKILIGLFLALAILLIGVYAIIKSGFNFTRRNKKAKAEKRDS